MLLKNFRNQHVGATLEQRHHVGFQRANSTPNARYLLAQRVVDEELAHHIDALEHVLTLDERNDLAPALFRRLFGSRRIALREFSGEFQHLVEVRCEVCVSLGDL